MLSAGRQRAARHALPLLFVFMASVAASVADLNEAGKAAYARGDYASAERLFSQAITRAPDQPLLHYHRAVALTQLGRFKEAADAYRAVLRLGPPASVAATSREALRGIDPLTKTPAPRQGRSEEDAIQLQRIPGAWIAEVVLNNNRTARFLVDTGASISVISPQIARELGIEPGVDAQVVELRTLSGRTNGALVTLASVRIGDVEARGVRAVVHDTGPSFEGILGNTFLARFTFTLDPDRGTLNLRPR